MLTVLSITSSPHMFILDTKGCSPYLWCSDTFDYGAKNHIRKATTLKQLDSALVQHVTHWEFIISSSSSITNIIILYET